MPSPSVETTKPPAGSLPFVSVVIPTYNRPALLADCLRSVRDLAYPRDRFEVIVVDDGGVTPLEAAVAAAAQGLDFTLLVRPHAGPAAARNAGAAKARGELIAFTDDDCAPAPDWLAALVARCATGCAAGGRTVNILVGNRYSAASQLLVDYFYRRCNADPEHARFLASNNVIVPTEEFRSIGGFEMASTLPAAEDRAFCEEWLSHGRRLVYVPEAMVRHAHALSISGFCRQQFNYGRGAFYTARRRVESGAARFGLEGPAFYRDLLRYPFSVRPRPGVWTLCALAVLSQAVHTAGFFSEWVAPVFDRSGNAPARNESP